MAWDDKPPTERELGVVAQAAPSAPTGGWDSLPPHPAELDRISQFANSLRGMGQDLGNSVGDASLGAVQGATIGFADELQGAGQAGVDAIQHGTSINPIDPAFLKKYREYQQAAEAPYKQAEERSPWLYGAGNLAGGVAIAPAFGAAGLATTGGRAAVGAALAEGGLGAAARTAGVEALKDAAVGAPAGALFGLGNSKGGVETPEGRQKLQDDALHGAATGGLVSGGLGLASSVVPVAAQSVASKVKNIIDDTDTPLARILKKSFKLGQEGTDLSDEVTQNKLFSKPVEESTDIMDQLEKADKMYGKAIGDSISSAEEQGLKVNIDESLNSAAKKITDFVNDSRNIELDNKSKDIIGRIVTQSGEISPTEAQYLRKQLKIVSDKVSAPGTGVPYPIQDALFNVQSGLTSAMKGIPTKAADGSITYAGGIPGYAQAAKNFANFRQNTVEQILSGAKSPDVTGVEFGSMRNADSRLQDKLIQMIQGGTTPGSGSRDSRAAFEVLKDKLNGLQKTNPEAFQAMGTDAPGMIGKIKNAADTDSMIQGITKTNPNEGLTSTAKGGALGIAGTGKSTLLSTANKIGLYGPKIMDAAGKPIQLTKKMLFDLPLSSTKAIADHLASNSSPAVKNLGEALQRAASNNDSVAKNAVLFSVLQNPNTRQLLDLQDDNK